MRTTELNIECVGVINSEENRRKLKKMKMQVNRNNYTITTRSRFSEIVKTNQLSNKTNLI